MSVVSSCGNPDSDRTSSKTQIQLFRDRQLVGARWLPTTTVRHCRKIQSILGHNRTKVLDYIRLDSHVNLSSIDDVIWISERVSLTSGPIPNQKAADMFQSDIWAKFQTWSPVRLEQSLVVATLLQINPVVYVLLQRIHELDPKTSVVPQKNRKRKTCCPNGPPEPRL